MPQPATGMCGRVASSSCVILAPLPRIPFCKRSLDALQQLASAEGRPPPPPETSVLQSFAREAGMLNCAAFRVGQRQRMAQHLTCDSKTIYKIIYNNEGIKKRKYIEFLKNAHVKILANFHDEKEN